MKCTIQQEYAPCAHIKGDQNAQGEQGAQSPCLQATRRRRENSHVANRLCAAAASALPAVKVRRPSAAGLCCQQRLHPLAGCHTPVHQVCPVQHLQAVQLVQVVDLQGGANNSPSNALFSLFQGVGVVWVQQQGRGLGRRQGCEVRSSPWRRAAQPPCPSALGLPTMTPWLRRRPAGDTSAPQLSCSTEAPLRRWKLATGSRARPL